MQTITRARSLDIRLFPGQINSKTDLGNLIGRRPSQFSVVCDSGKYLTEIRICFSLTSHPGTEAVRDCPYMSDTSCIYPITVTLPRWYQQYLILLFIYGYTNRSDSSFLIIQ